MVARDFSPCKNDARPLRRAIEHFLEDSLSESILRGDYKEKNRVVVSVQTNEDGVKNLYFEGQRAAVRKEEPEREPVAAGDTSEAT